jgi:YVTN family beta-propeller protein
LRFADKKQRWAKKGACAVVALGAAALFAALLGSGSAQPAATPPATPHAAANIAVRSAAYPYSTYSSPITLSADGRLLLVVNPDDDTLTVIRTDNNTVLREIAVGDEPRSVVIDPSNKFMYVANAAAGTVTVIRIVNSSFGKWKAQRLRTITTGAEPWNIVISPNGKRVFVANSNQDTVSVISGQNQKLIGTVNLRTSVCNGSDKTRHFQPRGMAVTQNNRYLYVTAFFSFVKAGGRQGDDSGREGIVCRLNINTNSTKIGAYKPAARIAMGPEVTGFTVDSTGDGVADPTSAFPNQMQSLVIRGNQAYLPSIAASPSGPLRFNVDTQAFVNVLDNVNSPYATDASAAKFLNLHLGARDPEAGKKRLFFANVWAIAFTNQSGAGTAYVVSAGSDLLVKVNVAADGKLGFTVDDNTTRYIDLNDPANPAASGDNAGMNPQGIIINRAGTRAYVMNYISRNVSVVDTTQDKVIATVRTRAEPAPGSAAETVQAGAAVFFSSRGNFNRPAGTTVSTSERLSSEGWQSCSSCHFEGLTDSVVWTFNTGPRKSVPLNGTFNPNNPAQQHMLNYSAIFDEVEDFEANIRNVSGPGALASPVACNAGAPNTTLDPNHGLLIGDNGDINTPPCTLNAFALPSANRQQLTLRLPGSTTNVPALTALREWVRLGIRTPRGPFGGAKLGAPSAPSVAAGRNLFQQAGCTNCHVGGLWTTSVKDFTAPPAAGDIATERTPAPVTGNPVAAQYLPRFLRNIGSFNLGVAGGGNAIGNNSGAPEKATQALVNGVAQTAQDGLGTDYNNDGKGNGFNVPSLLGIFAAPPYYHNGACETLACVLTDFRHRTANGTLTDRLGNASQQAQVVAFLETISARTAAFSRAAPTP